MEFIYDLFTDYTSEVEDVPIDHDGSGSGSGGNGGCVIA